MVTEEQLWAAVADPGRRRILDLLLAGHATPTALADQLPITRQAISKHLTVLAEAGLVEAQRQGRETRWRVRPAELETAAAAMSRAAAAWGVRLQAIKRLAEAATPAVTEPPPEGFEQLR